MLWENVINSAIIGGIFGGVVGLMMALFIRKTCPYCQPRYKLGMWGTRNAYPHCGGELSANQSSTSADE